MRPGGLCLGRPPVRKKLGRGHCEVGGGGGGLCLGRPPVRKKLGKGAL